MKKMSALALTGLVALAGCSSTTTKSSATTKASAPSASASSSATSADSSTSSPTSSSSDSSQSSSSGASESFAMPSEVGKGLQAAQDDVQKVSGNPIYISHSDDVLGKGRHQVIDSNWKVCSQTPAAGTTVTGGTDVRFKAVKLDETCP